MGENVGSSEQVEVAAGTKSQDRGYRRRGWKFKTDFSFKKQPQNKNLSTQKTPLLKLTLEIKTATMYTTMSSLLHMLKAWYSYRLPGRGEVGVS